MTVLFYSSSTNGCSEKVRRIVLEQMPMHHIEIFHNIDAFSERLRNGTYDVNLAILMVHTKQKLKSLVKMKELLETLRIVLILPSQNPENVSIGHKLYPRFMTYMNGNFTDLEAVLGKMAQQATYQASSENGRNERHSK